ncbi:MAG: hydroxyacylglutathione hydrolase [Pseudomonadota bacterium]
MTLDLEVVPCLDDNYAYIIHDTTSGAAAVIDVPEAQPVLDRLSARGWSASLVFLTHHHADHVQGLATLLQHHPAQVAGNAADAGRLPPLDIALHEGDTLSVGAGGETGQVLDVSGHTIGHLALYFPDSALAFTADSLMALGCGRVFEGTMPQMWASLQKLAALPPDTLICSGHEYTQSNARFALSVDGDNPELQKRAETVFAMREAGQPTVPSRLSEELATNPFLRAADPALQASLGMSRADPAQVFAEIRRRKDAF